MITQCIYKIVNKITQDQYIGSAIDLDRRKKRHIYELNKNVHHSRYLQNAWNYYGSEQFEFHIIEIVEHKNKLLEREDFYLKLLNPKYNTMREVKSHIGVKRSDETKKKMVLAHTGKKHSTETKEKIRILTTGVKQSKETIEKRMQCQFNSILQCDKNGSVIKEWKSATHAEQEEGFKRKSIYRCLWGDRKTYKDFIWKYKNYENEN